MDVSSRKMHRQSWLQPSIYFSPLCAQKHIQLVNCLMLALSLCCPEAVIFVLNEAADFTVRDCETLLHSLHMQTYC